MSTHIFDAESKYVDEPERPEGVEEEWVSLELDLVPAPGDDEAEVTDLGRTH